MIYNDHLVIIDGRSFAKPFCSALLSCREKLGCGLFESTVDTLAEIDAKLSTRLSWFVVTLPGEMMPRETFKNLETDKKQRILATAIDEFASHGFRQASMNRMVQKLAIAKGSLFQYFVNKEGLFRVIFDYAVDLVRQSLRQVKQETTTHDFFQRIRQSLIAGIHFIQQHPKIYRIYLKMIFQEDFPLRAEFLQQVHLFSSEYLRPLVEKGIADGDLRSDLNVNMAVFFLDALMDRFLQAYCVSFLDAGVGLYDASEAAVRQHVEAFIEIVRNGMSVQNARDDSAAEAMAEKGMPLAVGMGRDLS